MNTVLNANTYAKFLKELNGASTKTENLSLS